MRRMTDEEIISRAMSAMARKKHSRLTPAERTEQARALAAGRWARATPEDRARQAAAMLAGRRRKRRSET